MEQQQPDPAAEKRFYLALALSILVYAVFVEFIFEPPPPPPETVQDGVVEAGEFGEPSAAVALSEGTPEQGDDDSAVGDQVDSSPQTLASPTLPERSFEVSWHAVDATWSNRGGSPTSLRLRDYREGIKQPFLPTWLISGFSNNMEWEPFDIACHEPEPIDLVGDAGGVLFPVGIDSEGVSTDLANYEVIESGARRMAFRHVRGGVEVTKRFELPEDGYVVNYVVELRNVAGTPLAVKPAFAVADRVLTVSGQTANQRQIQVEVGDDVETENPEKVEKKVTLLTPGAVSWVALADKYFGVGLEPEQPIAGVAYQQTMPGEERYAAVMAPEPLTLRAGETRSYSFKLYAGPMVLTDLKDQDLRLASAVNFGIFGLVAMPILLFLKFIYGLLGSWGFSIIALTLVIKGLLFPLSLKANRSMTAMGSLGPEIEELKKKHGDDKEAFNKAQMALWQEHGVNPLGGCLPMIIQMPIWFALYRVLWNSVELYQSSFLWFCDLTLQDPIGILAVLYALVMWLTQKLTPMSGNMDPTQQKMMKYLPLMFSFIMFTLPAGLVMYILVSMTLGVGERLLLKRGATTTGAAATGGKA